MKITDISGRFIYPYFWNEESQLMADPFGDPIMDDDENRALIEAAPMMFSVLVDILELAAKPEWTEKDLHVIKNIEAILRFVNSPREARK